MAFAASSRGLALFFVLLTPVMCSGAAPLRPADQNIEIRDWVSYATPLPKEIKIRDRVEITADRISVVGEREIPELGKFAMEQLADFFLKETGTKINLDSPLAGGFTIKFVVCNESGYAAGRKIPDAQKLAKLPNSDQSYLIFPEGKTGLTIAALTEKGLYYGAATLKQLLRPALRKEANKIVVAVPLLKVIDWPDIPDRGFWGHGYDKDDIAWFSAHKLNLLEMYNRGAVVNEIGISKEGKGYAELNRDFIDFAYQHGVKAVPIIFHLEQLANGHFPGLKDMYERYPEMRAQGFKGSETPPCASSPKYKQLLTDWLSDMASYPRITDVCVWLSEWLLTADGNIGCSCSECLKSGGQREAETKALIEAWRTVRQKYPDRHLWILLSGSRETRAKLIALVLPNTNIHVYEYNYNTRLTPSVLPVEEKYIAAGGWLGVYPTVIAGYGTFFSPGYWPRFNKYHQKEYVEKKVRRFTGYTGLSSITLYDFNLEAAAEWSWNLNGRSENDFTLAYAVRKGLSKPEDFARWVSNLEPVAQKIYGGANFPAEYCCSDKILRILGTEDFRFGRGPLLNYGSPEEISQDLVVCQACEKLALGLGKPELADETLVIQSYLKLLKSMVDVNDALYGRSLLSKEEIRQEIAAAGTQTIEALKRWYGAKGKEDPEVRWFVETKAAQELTDGIRKQVKSLTDFLNTFVADARPQTGNSLKVGVFRPGYGAESIMNGLLEREKETSVSPFSVGHQITPEILKNCRVFILPQPYKSDRLKEDAEILRNWVKQGGRLLVTHDAVGYRSYPVIFPEICQGKDLQEKTSFLLLPDSLPFKKEAIGPVFNHTYYDRIILQPGKAVQKIVAGQDGEILAVYGSLGQGKVVATGMALGIGPGDKPIALSDGEMTFLLAALKWLGE